MSKTEYLTARQEIIETVQRIFINTDNRNWDQVKKQFAGQVLLDYTSMAGGEPSTLTPQTIVHLWKELLPGFEQTQHTLSNFEVAIHGDEATVSHYGTAWHYLRNEDGDDVWMVVGMYNHHLLKRNELWKVDQMRFTFKFMDGNADLPRLARERLSKESSNQN